LHPTSLPGPYGVGSLGRQALGFIDFLEASEQCIWQVLPLGPTGYGDSPYKSFSSFAGNPLLIDPEDLVLRGLLGPELLKDAPAFPEDHVDYGRVFAFKREMLKAAHRQWNRRADPAAAESFDAFCRRESTWLEDFSLFMALKRTFEAEGLNGAWSRWPEELIRREPETLELWKARLAEEIEHQKLQQFLFYSQWETVKRYAAERGIRIIGDLPIYVAYDSADAWANQELFHFDNEGLPTFVGGVPPDYFSDTGQLWGNPLYDWKIHEQQGYRWWIERVRTTLRLVDIVRLDHFRGFEAYWEVPAGEPTAVKGRWVEGPGAGLFAAIKQDLGREAGDLPLIAEDLGVITPPVQELRDRFGLPGMKVLQFAFDQDAGNEYLPHNYLPNCVVYTGTHDNDTTLGWFQGESQTVQDQVRRYLGRDGHDIVWDLIRLAYSSAADTAVIPLQDPMELDGRARMNVPSRAGGNWQWRFTRDMITEEIIGRLRELSRLYGRCP
jgi:4-alpha-glucanotransferase